MLRQSMHGQSSHAAHDMECAGRAFARAFQSRAKRLVWWRFERVTSSLHFVHTRLGGGGASRAFASRALNCAIPRRTRGLATPPSSGDGNSVFSQKMRARYTLCGSEPYLISLKRKRAMLPFLSSEEANSGGSKSAISKSAMSKLPPGAPQSDHKLFVENGQCGSGPINCPT